MARVLVFADDADFAEILGLCLQEAGHVVVREVDWRDAMALEAMQDFDVVLVDILPPERVGLHLLAEIRARGSGARIIACGWREDLHALARAGADHVLRKPFAYYQLLDAVRSAP